MYGYDGYDDDTSTIAPKYLPSVPVVASHQQVPYVATSSSTSLARNFFQSKNNTTFHSTVENVSEEDPLSSSAALNPHSNINKMSTNNSYELEDMSVDKSLFGSSFHTDIDEYDLIANGDIKQNFTYTEKNLVASGSGGGGLDINGVPLKTETAKSKLSHSFMDNDAVNNNSGGRTVAVSTAGATTAAVYGTKMNSSNDYGVDEYSGFNDGGHGGMAGQGGHGAMYGNRSEVDDYGVYQDQHQQNDHYYVDHQMMGGVGAGDEEQYYETGYGMSGGRKVPTSVSGGGVGSDLNAQEYYYNQMVELGAVVGSNLEGIEELDEYERDEKDVDEEDQAHYNYYNQTPTSTAGSGGSAYKKDALLKTRDHELFIEEDEEEEEDVLDEEVEHDEDRHFDRDHSEEFVHKDGGVDSKGVDDKLWNDDYRHHASDDEIIDAEAKKTATPVVTTTAAAIATHTEPVGPSPLSGISALMSSMAPAVASQSSLSPAGSMLAAGITTTLAANISNTITTTITGSPSIIFDTSGGENEAGASTISKTMGALVAGEGVAKMTPKQRWHHAYNKIIMQLNVSRHNNTWGLTVGKG